MPGDEKPYRVYRGGRRIHFPDLSLRRSSSARRAPPSRRPGSGPKGRRRWWRWIAVALGLLVVLLIAWGAASYFQFRSGVRAADRRLDPKAKTALVPGQGSVSYTLLLAIDRAPFGGRETAERTDSITLMRADTSRHRISYLSIPRDLRVETSRYSGKINGAMPRGGLPLAIATVREFTGLPVNHVVLVDFTQFRKLIDRIGGVDVTVDEPIISKFDCPYATEQRCARWPGWRFAKGRQHMDGRRALIYARIRKNSLNPADTDFTRVERNQQVIQAISNKLTSIWTVAKMPFIGKDLLAPIATDLSTGDMISLGWTKFRTSNAKTLHCRLGGEPSGGEIIPTEENRLVLSMFTGQSAAVQLFPSQFGPGCVRGNAKFKN
jgi:LCP family protein required for cell wall assembly